MEKPVLLSLILPKVPKSALRFPPELGTLNFALAFHTGGDKISARTVADKIVSAIIKKFSTLIENQKGVIIKTQEWGKQRLAYAIKKFHNGSYVLVDFCADPGVTAELERNLKLDDRILKYQTVKLADRADPQELLLKEKEANKKTTDEEVKDTEDSPPAQKDADTVEESEVKNGEE